MCACVCVCVCVRVCVCVSRTHTLTRTRDQTHSKKQENNDTLENPRNAQPHQPPRDDRWPPVDIATRQAAAGTDGAAHHARARSARGRIAQRCPPRSHAHPPRRGAAPPSHRFTSTPPPHRGRARRPVIYPRPATPAPASHCGTWGPGWHALGPRGAYCLRGRAGDALARATSARFF